MQTPKDDAGRKYISFRVERVLERGSLARFTVYSRIRRLELYGTDECDAVVDTSARVINFSSMCSRRMMGLWFATTRYRESL